MNSSNLTLEMKNEGTKQSNATSEGGVSTQLRVAKLCVYITILLCSACGNTLVILSVALFKRMRTVPNLFIANLAACDLITTVSSIPFDVIAEELGYWPYGSVMCKLLWPLATLTTIAAVLTLLAISADRYVALLYPLKLRYRVTKRRFYIIMVAIYATACWTILPYMVFQQHISEYGPDKLPICSESWPDLKYRKAYTVFLFCLQYGIPLPIMTFIYIRLGLVLHRNTKKANAFIGKKGANSRANYKKYVRTESNSSAGSIDSRTLSLRRRKQQNHKTVKMFLFIVIIFLVFMLPNQILWLLYDFGNLETLETHVDLIAFICRVFTYTNSVLNAAIYGACNGSFRNAFLSTLKCQCGRRHQRQHQRCVSAYRRDGYCNVRYYTRNGDAFKHGSGYSKDDTADTYDSETEKKKNGSPSPSKKSVNFLFPTCQSSYEIKPVDDNVKDTKDNNGTNKDEICRDNRSLDAKLLEETTRGEELTEDITDTQDLMRRINRDMENEEQSLNSDSLDDMAVFIGQDDDPKETAL